MTHVVCDMKVEEKRVSFTWSEGPASFEKYALNGMDYSQFKKAAEKSRDSLANLVKDYLRDQDNAPQATYDLANAGYQLYQSMFCLGNKTAEKVQEWLTELSQKDTVDTIEIVVDSPWALPWNVIYDQKPEKDKFLGADVSDDRWKPFWGLKYNLCGGGGVNPLRRVPILRDPNVFVVIDPEIRDGLPEEQRERLAEFVKSHDLKTLHTKKELEEAIERQRPDLLYWMSHASPEALILSDEPVSPSDLLQLLRQKANDDVRFGGLAFLNSCQTAEFAGEDGSFFEAFHKAGFAGMIGTEHQTIDQFANPLGLDFLEAFLDNGESVGSAMRRLRGRVPLGLLYGTYCPPDTRVIWGEQSANIDVEPVSNVQGIALGVAAAKPKPNESHQPPKTLPPLPAEPYRSLAYYDREDRALFAGRDDDIERFAIYLDDASTRVLVLHGESGVGKSSFLRAGVIPYLEEECIGYQFIRDWRQNQGNREQGSVLFVRATNDLFSQLAIALWEFCAKPYEYETPVGEKILVNLPELLGELLPPLDKPSDSEGSKWNHGPAIILQENPSLLGRILSAISDRLPFSPILVIDQGEEIFTLAKTPEEQQRGRQALDALRLTIGASGNFKIIFALRTEYYGRVIDRLRRGLNDTGSIREYLLTDFDREDLVEAISRPTFAKRLRYSSEVPLDKYKFRYDDGLPEEIARRVLAHSGGRRRGGLLPLAQVVCGHLYERVRDREDKVVRRGDLDALGGVKGGMQKHVDTMLAKLTRDNPGDKKHFKILLTKLYNRQSDGSLTTALLPEDELARRWSGFQPFPQMLADAEDLRLLRVASLRIGEQNERRHVSLGHDALAKIAADWDGTFEKNRRFWRMAAVSLGVVVLVMLISGFVIRDQNNKATNARMLAKKQKDADDIKFKAEEEKRITAQENETKTRKLLEDTQAAKRSMRRARYSDQMKVALSYKKDHPVRMERALADIVPQDMAKEDLRGFEWFYLKHTTLQSKQTIPTPVDEFHRIIWMPKPGVMLLNHPGGLSFASASSSALPAADDWKPLPVESPTNLTAAINAPICGVVSGKTIRLFELAASGVQALAPIAIQADMVEITGRDPSRLHLLIISPDGKKVALATRIMRSDGIDIKYETHIAVFDPGHPSVIARTAAPLFKGVQPGTLRAMQTMIGDEYQDVNSMAFTPSGDLAVVTENPVDLWILETDGLELKPRPKVSLVPRNEPSLDHHSFSVLSQNGEQLAVWDDRNAWVVLRKLPALRPVDDTLLERPEDLTGEVLDIDFSVDGDHVVVLVASEIQQSTTFDAAWYVRTGKEREIAISRGLDNGVNRWPLPWCAIGPRFDGPRLLWKGDEAALRAMVREANEPSEKLFKSLSGVSSLRRNPSGDKLAFGTDQEKENQRFTVTRLIDLKSLKQSRIGATSDWLDLRAGSTIVSDDGKYFAGMKNPAPSDAISLNTFQLYCARLDESKLKNVKLGDLANTELTQILGFRPKHQQLYVRELGRDVIERWDITADGLTPGPSYRCDRGELEYGGSFSLTTDRVLFATNRAIYAWNADTGERLHEPTPCTGIVAIEMLGDDRHLATKVRQPPNYKNQLIIWDTKDWTEVCRRNLPNGLSHESYAIHPSGSRIVSGEMPGRITFLDIGPWAEDVEIRELISFEVEGKVKNLLFSSDGQSLAWLDGTNVRVWRAPGTPKTRQD